MADESIKPWDRLPDEPKAAYARFLFFLTLGPGRTVQGAYREYCGEKKGTERPGSWTRESTRFRWLDRSRDWDIATHRKAVDEAASYLTALTTEIARTALATIKMGSKPGSRAWASILKTYETITSRIPDPLEPDGATKTFRPPRRGGGG